MPIFIPPSCNGSPATSSHLYVVDIATSLSSTVSNVSQPVSLDVLVSRLSMGGGRDAREIGIYRSGGADSNGMDRMNSQKPADELYATFRQTFPEVGPGTATSTPAPSASTASLSDALTDPTMNHRYTSLHYA